MSPSPARHQDAHVMAVQRTLDAVFQHVPGAREAFPALARVREQLGMVGLRALDELPPLDREGTLARLKTLVPAFGPKQLNALLDVLSGIDRRSLQRPRELAAQVSTPELFVAEVPMETFLQALDELPASSA
jgi:hypothetical protein